MCRWLVDNELASTLESASLSGLESRREASESKPKPQRWNPLFQRISLFRPDGLLRRLLPWFGWIFSWPATVAGLIFCAVAANEVLTQWSRLLVSTRGVFSSERWFWIAVAWLTVKALHELAHGIVCKRYGGSVRDAGIVLMMGAPLAYMDVSSSWSFRSKWHCGAARVCFATHRESIGRRSLDVPPAALVSRKRRTATASPLGGLLPSCGKRSSNALARALPTP